ncbi:metal-dependent transcriptional regulator [Salinigranum rubrum]|uniref:Metal-dependent transcriptional regulator n=1 Tax=Salinigranum rubrum TaxID=755307 RepID=A0A2I8VPL8_9EURY|nr:metal-dependent transcriptional regulator [Salinigranum rubrum]AUV83824.1 metal-dependent transcriptional regulator [Salinigranum rubrum]
MSEASQYLLAVYLVEREASAPVAPGTVADAVNRSPSAATEMLQRLDERGLVVHEPYEGASLTPAGRDTAEELHETYLVLSRFFRDVLELDDYDDEAMRLAGNVSPVVAEQLATNLLDDEDTQMRRDTTHQFVGDGDG